MADAARLHSGLPMYVQVPVADATVISIGDLIKLDTALGVRVTAAGDNLTLYAVALQAHANGDGAITICCARVIPGTIWLFPLNTSTAATIGQEYQASGAQELTQSGTDPIANAVETNATATTLRVEFKVPVLLQGDLT